MKYLFQILLTLFLFLVFLPSGFSQKNQQKTYKYMSCNNVLMVGYQGWFNAEGDGANRGWNHYTQDSIFAPGHTKVDYWPDVSDYPVKYKTAFQLANGQPAYVFSSYDESTVDLHFKWMHDY